MKRQGQRFQRRWRAGAVAILAVVMLSALFLSRCAGAPARNGTLSEENRVDEIGVIDPRRPVIVMSFSGGGVRAAALGYFVLELLKNARYSVNGVPHRLVDDVRVVSSVSGGSVVAAYFALFGPDHLDELRTKFIARRNVASILWHILNPARSGQLAFSGYSRSDAFAEWLDRVLFKKARYRDVRMPGKPLLVVNATDMSAGEIFTFNYQTFDDICSDLGSFPVALAVAASAAFPVFMSPVTLTNHTGPGCRDVVSDEPVEPAGLSLEVLRMQRYSGELRRARDAVREVQYIHLVDGGLSDNLGVRSLMRLLKHPSAVRVNLDAFSKLVVIAVNARVGGTPELDRSASTPGVVDVLNAVASVPMGNSSDNLLAELESFIGTIYPDDKPWVVRKRAKFIKVDLADSAGFCTKEFTQRLNSIPTSWTISAEDLVYLKTAARVLLSQEPGFVHLEHELKGEFSPQGEPLIESMLFCQKNQRPGPR
jgi:NTE family protein